MAIDFKQLRKLEKLRIKQEMLDKKKKEMGNDSRSVVTGGMIGAYPDKGKIGTINPDKGINESSTHLNNSKRSPDCGLRNREALPSLSPLVTPRCPHPCSPSTIERLDEILHEHKIKDSTCSDLYYMQKFLSEDFSGSLIEWLQALPRGQEAKTSTASKSEEFNGRWTSLKFAQRNVAMFDLLSCAAMSGSGNGNMDSTGRDVPEHLRSICDILLSMKAFPSSHPPNHVLINEYNGQGGILPHTDGPIYFDRTATVSVGGGDVLFQFTKRDLPENEDDERDSPIQLKLHGQGSLVVFSGDAYTKYCHSIQDRVDDMVEYAGANCVNASEGERIERGYRISLTFRHKLQ